MKTSLLTFLLLFVFFTNSSHAQGKKSITNVDITPLITLANFSKTSPESFQNLYKRGKAYHFKWLNKEKTRAIFSRAPYSNVTNNLTALEGQLKIDEAVVDFEDGALSGITISIFNRGDSGKITQTEFDSRYNKTKDYITKQLNKRPSSRKGNISRGIMTTGLKWKSPLGSAVLVHNNEVPKVHEFLRLRLSSPDAEGIYKAALEDRSYATVRKSRLPRNVVEKDGNVLITNIPMVDQGAKGYCVVASTQRVFEYYGISCSMHQLAQLAKSDPKNGTSTLKVVEQLSSIDYLFQTRFSCLAIKHENRFVKLEDGNLVGKDISKKSFYKLIYSNIDKGLPLLWSLELGVKPEVPNLNPQTSGGHMRIIIGYNLKENKIIFSDSWGAGHEQKTMDADDFYKVTKGLFLLSPTNH